MAFQIPPEAFRSFSRKQTIDTLYRLLGQLDAAKEGSISQEENLKALKSYLDILDQHDTPALKELSKKLRNHFPNSPETREKCLMIMERELSLDIPEDEFLISTQDTKEHKNSQRISKLEIRMVLDNLRSSFNVGSIFRSAEAFGSTQIYLCGYTATPENSKTAKSALGADDWVSWTHYDNTLACIDELKAQGFLILALETVENSVSLESWKPSPELNQNKKVAVVLGNERYGLGSPVLKKADYILKVDLLGRKNSLNVGVCGAITLNWLRQLPLSS